MSPCLNRLCLFFGTTYTISTFLQKHCNKKQETEECILKLCGYIYHQGTYTPQVGNEKGAGFLPFTGVSLLYCTGNLPLVS